MSEPVVGLPEVIKDDPRAVVGPRREHDGGRAVSLAGHPRAVEGVRHQEQGHHRHESAGDLTKKYMK